MNDAIVVNNYNLVEIIHEVMVNAHCELVVN